MRFSLFVVFFLVSEVTPVCHRRLAETLAESWFMLLVDLGEANHPLHLLYAKLPRLC
tara:strand:+ start:3415 stop:3585 length:171 start_codon:yes stop_codon:yes gene_type:complete